MDRQTKRILGLLLIISVVGCSKEASQDSPIKPHHGSERKTVDRTSCETKKKVATTTLERMFEAAFGVSPPLGRPAPAGGRESCYRYEPAGTVRLAKTEALISEAFTEDCHGCFGTLSIHYLRKVNNAFERVGGWIDVAAGNGWGRPPRWIVRRDLTRYPALEIRTEFSNNGYGCEWISLIELTPKRPIIRIQKTAAGYDTTGAVGHEKGQAITSVFRLDRNGDINLIFEGTSAGALKYSPYQDGYVASGQNPTATCES